MSHKPNTTVLTLLVSYAAVSAVLFTPALPQIMQTMKISGTTAQLTVAIFLMGYALGQLLYGPISNAYGRKKALYFGFSLAVLGNIISIIACLTQQIYLLLFARFITAIGACSGYAITFTIINDVYDLAQARKVLATVILAFAVAPGIAVGVGGLLAEYFGWMACFYLLLLYGILLFAGIATLPETGTQLSQSHLQFNNIVHSYSQLLSNKRFMLFALFCAVWAAFLYLYYTNGPFIAEHDFHMSSLAYGATSLITSGGYFIGNIITQLSSHHRSAKQVIHYGLMVLLLGIALLGIDAFEPHHWHALFFIAIAICFLGGAALVSNAIALGLHRIKNVAAASALFGFISLCGPMLCISLNSLMGEAHLQGLFFIFLGLFFVLFTLNQQINRQRWYA